jgi:translation initiation factor 2B subunit (eIF-2B alpha/beta/delta family)
MKYVTRAFNLEYLEFDSCKQELLRRGENLADTSLRARNQIAELGHSFITDGCTVLVHGSSRVVTSLILKAAQTKAFTVVVTEAKPVSDFFNCFEHAEAYAAAGIPTKIIMDSAVGSVMESCDLCILGAEGVMENGGIVNKVGTYQIALCAKALRKPFYVAVESYKFARYYPLCQKDIQHLGGMGGRKVRQQSNVTCINYLSFLASTFTHRRRVPGSARVNLWRRAWTSLRTRPLCLGGRSRAAPAQLIHCKKLVIFLSSVRN